MYTLLLALPLIATFAEPRLWHVQAVVYQGYPEGKANQRPNELIRTPFVVRDGQQSLVAVSQGNTDLKWAGAANGQRQVINEILIPGYVIDVIPSGLIDGSVVLTTTITATELIENAAEDRCLTRQTTTKFSTVCKPGEKVTVPLYNPSDYRDVVGFTLWTGAQIQKTVNKPFTGHERWIEFVVRSHKDKDRKWEDFPKGEFLPVAPAGIPQAVPLK